MLSFSKTDFVFDIMCKTQLEQQAEVTDLLTKFHILTSFYTRYEINTVVHLWQIFMENLGARGTGKKKFICLYCYPVLYFHFLLSLVYIHDSE